MYKKIHVLEDKDLILHKLQKIQEETVNDKKTWWQAQICATIQSEATIQDPAAT